jgi:hypothetical protein
VSLCLPAISRNFAFHVRRVGFVETHPKIQSRGSPGAFSHMRRSQIVVCTPQTRRAG